MTLTTNDYRVIATGVVNGVICKNVFWYKDVVGGGLAVDLAAVFSTDIIDELIKVQSSSFQWTNLDVYNLVNPSNFYVTTLSQAGLRPSAVMPNFVSWYMRYFRPTTIVHDGRKAIAGVAEVDVTDGHIVTTLEVTMDLVTDALQAQLIDGSGTPYSACIAKTEPYTNPVTGKTYRVPIELFPIERVEYVRVSTQNSRKR